jgi:histidinol-phosphate aminotransferase
MSLPFRPNVLKMRPYSPGKPLDEVKRELGLTDVIKLASNENPLGPPPKAVEAIREAAAEANIYPDAAGFDLKNAIAEMHGLKPENVVLGNGSDELIHYLGLILLEGEGTELVMGNPSFVRYDASAQLANAVLTKIPVDKDWRHDVDAMAAACSDKTRLVYVANPNNPTGTVIDQAETDRLLAAIPSDALLIMDEAYYEFGVKHPYFPKTVDMIKAEKPVCVLRTFSKAYGLAGIRVGYGLAPAHVIDAIERVREPFNVTSISQKAAIAALNSQDHVEKTVKLNREGIERVEAAAKEMGLNTVESFANFVCIDMGRPAEPVFQELLRGGVIVRSGHVLGMPNHIRVSIGSPDEMTRFIELFKTLA